MKIHQNPMQIQQRTCQSRKDWKAARALAASWSQAGGRTPAFSATYIAPQPTALKAGQKTVCKNKRFNIKTCVPH